MTNRYMARTQIISRVDAGHRTGAAVVTGQSFSLRGSQAAFDLNKMPNSMKTTLYRFIFLTINLPAKPQLTSILLKKFDFKYINTNLEFIVNFHKQIKHFCTN